MTPTKLSFLIAGYGSVRSLMNYEEDEQSPSSSSELRRHNSLSSRPPSSLGMLSQIPEIASESSFQYNHWNDPASFIDNLSSLKRETEDDGKLFQVYTRFSTWFDTTEPV